MHELSFPANYEKIRANFEDVYMFGNWMYICLDVYMFTFFLNSVRYKKPVYKKPSTSAEKDRGLRSF